MDAEQGIEQVFKNAENVDMPPEMCADPIPPAPPSIMGPGDGELPEVVGGRFRLNDFGNGQRLIHYHGRDLLFVPRLGWFSWTGTRWLADEDEIEVRKLGQCIADDIENEIWHLEVPDNDRELIRDAQEAEAELEVALCKPEIDKDETAGLGRRIKRAAKARKAISARRKSHRSHANQSGNSNRIKNLLLEASVLKAITIDDLNADKLMVNTEGGTLHFEKRVDAHDAAWEKNPKPKWNYTVRAHDRAHLISKVCPVKFDPAATCPEFEKFLEQIIPDPEVRAYLKRWFGYSLTGLTDAQKLSFFYGGGRNGKSTLVELIAKIIGDYGTTLPIESLTGDQQRKGSDATPDLVRLPGARLVRASEPDKGQSMKEGLIKALTGGEAILIRRMMKEFVEITPEFKLTISGNSRPEIRGSDDGIWRRINLIPFNVQIAEDDVDSDLSKKLWAERAGVLNWMIAGALEYLENGLQEPEAIKAATQEYRNDSDPTRVFLQEECELTDNPSDFVRARDLIEAFNAWMLEKREGVWGQRTVANNFKARADSFKDDEGRKYSPKKRSDTGYGGLKLKESAKSRVSDMQLELDAAMNRKG